MGLEIQEMFGKDVIRSVLPIKDQFVVSKVFLMDMKDGDHCPFTKKIITELLKVIISVLLRLYIRVIIDLDMLLIDTLRSGDYDRARHSNLPLSMSGFLCNLPLSISGFCDKPGEVSLESSRVSGKCGRFKKYDIETDRGKSFKNFNLLQSNFSQPRDIYFYN